MKKSGYYILAFDSTHHAIKAEEQLKKHKLEAEMIPTPRGVDASCGLSIKIPDRCLERVRELIDMPGSRVKLYRVGAKEGRTVYVEQEM
ncbi:MAG TPA: DUF3343 domain-containing protein [Clostridia bacterium]|jgi:hypothetical protein|nr:DUF3343 domain-containing protein [Clostridia bacterium]